MTEKTTYKQVKNLVHNELGIDLERLIKDEIERQIKSMMNDKPYMENLIMRYIQKHLSWKIVYSIAETVANRTKLVTEKKS